MPSHSHQNQGHKPAESSQSKAEDAKQADPKPTDAQKLQEDLEKLKAELEATAKLQATEAKRLKEEAERLEAEKGLLVASKAPVPTAGSALRTREEILASRNATLSSRARALGDKEITEIVCPHVNIGLAWERINLLTPEGTPEELLPKPPVARSFVVAPMAGSKLPILKVSNCLDQADAKCCYFQQTKADPGKTQVEVILA